MPAPPATSAAPAPSGPAPSGLVLPEPVLRWAAPAALALFVVVGAVLSHRPSPVAAGLAVAGVASAAGIVLPGRRGQVAGLGVIAAVSVLCVDNPSNVGLFALCVVVGWGTVTGGPRVGAAFGAATWAALLVGALGLSGDGGWGAWFAASAVVWFVGVLVRRQRVLLVALQEAQAGLAERSAAAERHRIAREMHDVVGHALTVAVLHVTSARLALDDEDDLGRAEARASLAEAERLAQQGLAEVRAAVGLMRETGAGPVAPLPGAGDVGSLVTSFRDAGAPVTLEVDGDPGALTSTTGLAVYRIVQEALTNAVRHAPGSAATVRVGVDATATRVTVDSSGPAAASWTAGPGAAARSGTGLVGMRERAEAVGGHLDAGPVDGGWRVEAVLPR